jgi:hypothetical protein
VRIDAFAHTDVAVQVRMDTKDDEVTETYPTIFFAVNDFQEMLQDLTVGEEGELVPFPHITASAVSCSLLSLSRPYTDRCPRASFGTPAGVREAACHDARGLIDVDPSRRGHGQSGPIIGLQKERAHHHLQRR